MVSEGNLSSQAKPHKSGTEKRNAMLTRQYVCISVLRSAVGEQRVIGRLVAPDRFQFLKSKKVIIWRNSRSTLEVLAKNFSLSRVPGRLSQTN